MSRQNPYIITARKAQILFTLDDYNLWISLCNNISFLFH